MERHKLNNLTNIHPLYRFQRGEQKVSLPTTIFVGTIVVFGIGLVFAAIFKAIILLDLVLYLSYVKLAVTLIKYTPQAYMNYKRQATTGWSIHNILLDFTGGLLSITQMFLLAYNYDDWISIFGNFTKFGLGAISIVFDIIFVLQHYVFYLQLGTVEVTEEPPEPVISVSVRSYRSNQMQDSQSEHDSQSSLQDRES